MAESIEIAAPAKINLFLKVLGKRPDGYHDIYSWFQAVSLSDNLTISLADSDNVRLKIKGDTDLMPDRSNIVSKAAQLMRERFGLDRGMDILLEKNIPVAAGMGGGSSDAAATIKGINRLFGLGLDNKKMAEIGLEMGSDIPFFFSSGQAEVTGRGENIDEIELPLNYEIILITPYLEISTGAAYASLKMGLTSSRSDIKLFACKDFKGLIDELTQIGNDFEFEHFKAFPVLTEIKNALLDIGASLVRMSGSGPTIFGLFENIPEGEGIRRLSRRDWRTFRVKPVYLPAWER